MDTKADLMISRSILDTEIYLFVIESSLNVHTDPFKLVAIEMIWFTRSLLVLHLLSTAGSGSCVSISRCSQSCSFSHICCFSALACFFPL